MNRVPVSQLMIPNPVTIAPDQTIGRAMELMARYDDRRLPVMKSGALVGIVSDRDVKNLGGRPTVKLPKGAQDDAYLALSVEEAMTPSVITIHEAQPVQEAIARLLKYKIGGLPVVNQKGALVGMVSYVDILKYCLDLLDREADR